MKCILLAAGYATRLYPLTQDRPKALLPIGGGSILDFLIAKISAVPVIEHVYLVTNARFYPQFVAWADITANADRVTILNDGTLNNEDRLGAIADLQFAISQATIADDVLVLAADNLFDFALTDFVSFFERVGENCITVHALHDQAALQRTGVVELDDSARVTGFEEKPLLPKSCWAVPPFYLFRQDSLPLIGQYLQEGNPPDAPGNLIPWLVQRRPVYAFQFQGNRYDIGTLESYHHAIRVFGQPVRGAECDRK